MKIIKKNDSISFSHHKEDIYQTKLLQLHNALVICRVIKIFAQQDFS